MKDRIAQIMKSENMTQQEFAAALDISPSTLSSIFNERTQPSLAIVYKIRDRFPTINLMWLLYGDGDMYNEAPSTEDKPALSSGNSSASQDTEKVASAPGATPDLFSNTQRTSATPVSEKLIEKVKYIDKPQRRITEINVYFDDGTYEVFVPRRKD